MEQQGRYRAAHWRTHLLTPPNRPERSYRTIKAIKESLEFCRTPTSTYTYCFSGCREAAGGGQTAFFSLLFATKTATTGAGAAARTGPASRGFCRNGSRRSHPLRRKTGEITGQDEKVKLSCFCILKRFSPLRRGRRSPTLRWRTDAGAARSSRCANGSQSAAGTSAFCSRNLLSSPSSFQTLLHF